MVRNISEHSQMGAFRKTRPFLDLVSVGWTKSPKKRLNVLLPCNITTEQANSQNEPDVYEAFEFHDRWLRTLITVMAGKYKEARH